MSKKGISQQNFTDTEEKKKKVEKLIDNYIDVKGPLMPILQGVQEIYGYLPFLVVENISEILNIPLEEIYGVITFYTQFKLQAKGKFQISICLGTVCYVKGSEDILSEVKKVLDINDGECTKDGLFSLDTTRCLGCCSMAPVLMINDKVYGHVRKQDVKKIIDEYRGDK